MPLRRLLPLIGLLLLLAPAALAQERRVALVVGNGAYRHATALANPGNDADGVARTLADLGFRVTLLRDLGVSAFREALLDFADAARGADVALFFFAGHGLQMGLRDRAENFLVPVDAALADARRLEDETIRLSRVLELMETARARVVILDACRDNPLLAAMANTGGTRSVGRGLAPIEGAAQGTLIAFSTAPGAIAADGRGNNSPFTEALLRHLPTPALEFRTVLTRVRAEVARATGNAQTPWSNDGLLTELFLAGREAPAAAPAPQAALPPIVAAVPAEAMELVFWQSIQTTRRPEELGEFLRRFPDGTFAGLARSRLAEMQRAEASREAAPAAAAAEAERQRQEAERARHGGAGPPRRGRGGAAAGDAGRQPAEADGRRAAPGRRARSGGGRARPLARPRRVDGDPAGARRARVPAGHAGWRRRASDTGGAAGVAGGPWPARDRLPGGCRPRPAARGGPRAAGAAGRGGAPARRGGAGRTAGAACGRVQPGGRDRAGRLLALERQRRFHRAPGDLLQRPLGRQLCA